MSSRIKTVRDNGGAETRHVRGRTVRADGKIRGGKSKPKPKPKITTLNR